MVRGNSAALAEMRDPSASIMGVKDDITTRKMQLLVSFRFSTIASNVNPEVRYRRCMKNRSIG
jgi:hypothetical protein